MPHEFHANVSKLGVGTNCEHSYPKSADNEDRASGARALGMSVDREVPAVSEEAEDYGGS